MSIDKRFMKPLKNMKYAVEILSLVTVFSLSGSLFVAYYFLSKDYPTISAIMIAIAGSLMAAFIFAVLTRVSKYAEDLHNEEVALTSLGKLIKSEFSPTHKSISDLKSTVEIMTKDIQDVECRWSLSFKNVVKFLGQKSDKNASFIIAKHPREFVSDAIGSETRRIIEIDAIGLNLDAFYKNHLEELLEKRNVKLRIILPNPNSSGLPLVCKREGRDIEAVKEKINELSKIIYSEVETKNSNIRWGEDVPSITMVRINGAMVWRPRFFNEFRSGENFYCVFDKEINTKLFNILSEEFSEIWEAGSQVSTVLIND